MPDGEVTSGIETKRLSKTLILSGAFLRVPAGAAWWFVSRPEPLKAEHSKPRSKIKAKLKEALVPVLQERVPELGVSEVYFTDFLVQR